MQKEEQPSARLRETQKVGNGGRGQQMTTHIEGLSHNRKKTTHQEKLHPPDKGTKQVWPRVLGSYGSENALADVKRVAQSLEQGGDILLVLVREAPTRVVKLGHKLQDALEILDGRSQQALLRDGLRVATLHLLFRGGDIPTHIP